MLQSAITVFFPILCIIQKYYQDYQQIASMGAISVKEATSKIIHENPSKKERLDYKENFMYTMPSVNYGDTKLFPPPISCLSLFHEARHFSYYKLNMNDVTFSEEEVIVLGRDTMSCLRHNSHQKLWFPRRPRVEEQQHQGGDDDDDDDDDDNDSSDDSSSSESDYYYTTSDEDLDDDDDDSDLENPDHDGDESIGNNNNNNEHYRNGGDYSSNLEEEEDITDIGDDREGNANNEGGNENGNNNNTS